MLSVLIHAKSVISAIIFQLPPHVYLKKWFGSMGSHRMKRVIADMT